MQQYQAAITLNVPYHKMSILLAFNSYSLVRPLFFHKGATIPICSSGGHIHEAVSSNQPQPTVASSKTLKAISLKSITWHLTLHSPTLSMSQWIADIWSRLRRLKTVILLRPSFHQGLKLRHDSCYTFYKATDVFGHRLHWSHILKMQLLDWTEEF